VPKLKPHQLEKELDHASRKERLRQRKRSLRRKKRER